MLGGTYKVSIKILGPRSPDTLGITDFEIPFQVLEMNVSLCLQSFSADEFEDS